MPRKLKLAQTFSVLRTGEGGALDIMVDGEPFPFYLADRRIDVVSLDESDPDRQFMQVTLHLLVEKEVTIHTDAIGDVV